jgi:hypothetical protein
MTASGPSFAGSEDPAYIWFTDHGLLAADRGPQEACESFFGGADLQVRPGMAEPEGSAVRRTAEE